MIKERILNSGIMTFLKTLNSNALQHLNFILIRKEVDNPKYSRLSIINKNCYADTFYLRSTSGYVIALFIRLAAVNQNLTVSPTTDLKTKRNLAYHTVIF